MPIDCAFSGCSGLASVYITDIEKWCKISFKNDVSNPLYYAHNLYLNNKLVTDFVIPDSITSIGAYAFIGCSGFTSVTIPDGVTSIGASAINSERDFRKTQQKISNNIENSLQMIA